MMCRCRMLQLLLVVVLVGTHCAQCAPRPQDSATNNIITETMTDEDGESLVASLILAVARDWDMGHEDATEFVRAVPALSVSSSPSVNAALPRAALPREAVTLDAKHTVAGQDGDGRKDSSF